MKQYGRALRDISAGSTPVYRFIEHDQHNIRLQVIGDKDRYVLLDKQTLQAFAKAFSELAKEFTK